VQGQVSTSGTATGARPAHSLPVVQQPGAPQLVPQLPGGLTTAPGVPVRAAGGGGAPPPAVQLPEAISLLLSRAAAVAQGRRPHSSNASGSSSMAVPGVGTASSSRSQAGAVVGVPAGGGDATAPTASTSAVASTGGGVAAQVGSSGSKPQGARECVVCLEEEPRVLLLPCRHMCCCEGCSAALQAAGSKECPMCRAVVEQHISVFL
jgi:hypothetical protein